MAWMPGASSAQTFTGNRHRASIDKIILHTTEGSSWPGYWGGAVAPHFTVHRDGSIRQHIDTEYSAKALENDAGGVQTNNDGAVQIEFIGSCDRSYARRHGLFFTEDADNEDLAGLARVLAWVHEVHGVPLTDRGLDWTDTNAAYEGAPQRMSYSQWRRFSGVCGHTHVPENAHWDPGRFPVARLLKLAGGAAPKAEPWESSRTIVTMPKGTVKGVQRLLAGLGYSLGPYGVDGSYGEDTYNAVRAAQKDLGVAVDGVAGPVTIAALKAASGKPSIPSIPSGGTSVPVPQPATTKDGELTVDGRFGHDSVEALQRFLNSGDRGGRTLAVDGKAGHDTWKALQHYLGTPVDGEVSNQSYRAEELGNGIAQGWDYDGRGASGSTMVRALQAWVGVTADGIWGEDTTTGLQLKLNDHGVGMG